MISFDVKHRLTVVHSRGFQLMYRNVSWPRLAAFTSVCSLLISHTATQMNRRTVYSPKNICLSSDGILDAIGYYKPNVAPLNSLAELLFASSASRDQWILYLSSYFDIVG